MRPQERFSTQTAPGMLPHLLSAPQPQVSGAASPQKLRPDVVTQQRHRPENVGLWQLVLIGSRAPALLAIVQIPWFRAWRHFFLPFRPAHSPDSHWLPRRHGWPFSRNAALVRSAVAVPRTTAKTPPAATRKT